MSLRNRARALAAKAGITYQQAVKRLRDAGSEPAEIKEATGWSLHRADVVAVDPRLDEEYSEVASGARYVDTETCENCGIGYFRSFDKKGMEVGGSQHFCPECCDDYGSWICPRCGDEILGDGDGLAICDGCWNYVMDKD